MSRKFIDLTSRPKLYEFGQHLHTTRFCYVLVVHVGLSFKRRKKDATVKRNNFADKIRSKQFGDNNSFVCPHLNFHFVLILSFFFGQVGRVLFVTSDYITYNISLCISFYQTNLISDDHVILNILYGLRFSRFSAAEVRTSCSIIKKNFATIVSLI